MTGRRQLMLTVMAGAVGLMASPALAQEAAEPADALPEVEVIQQKAPPPAAKKAAPAPQATPTPQPPPAYDYVDAEPPAPGPGERGADGRVISNAPNINPVNPASGILPTDTQNLAGAGTRVTSQQIQERHPKDTHELLARVPGVIVVQDDGMANHVNIGMRGSPTRRSRKVLIMEDGVPINFSTYLDASTHYTPPVHRVESVEVFRGPIVSHGPLNNHGVINFRNLNPFGPSETVVTAAIGHTDGVDKNVNNYRHVHTRQNFGNVGVVASYSGGEAGGVWNNEELGYNDFYGALAWRGFNQDLTISGGYYRQRDDYDETNFRGTEAQFYANKRRKSGNTAFFGSHAAANDLNNYNADLYRIQAAHNWYIDPDTTLSTRVYYHHHERNRFESRGNGPFAGGGMRGREREYEFFGVDSRVEFANLTLGGITYDLQAGVRFERHNFDNCNTSVPSSGIVLNSRNSGVCFPRNDHVPPLLDNTARQKYEADSFAAFIQAAVHVTRDLTITPGVRFENYDVERTGLWGNNFIVPPNVQTSDHDHVLPMIAFAWEVAPRSTFYGGFHQGITPQVSRGPAFPLPDEKGDNYEIGFRTTAVRGLTLDFAYFHSKIDDYQIKSPMTNALGNAIFGTVDEVEINGFEIYSRLDSQPYTGGRFNVFGEAVYTFSDNEITRGTDTIILAAGDPPTLNTVDVSGNLVPEIPRHFATLTLGVEEKGLWDASVTGTYIGEFFTDARNTKEWTCVTENGAPAACPSDAVVGKVDGQWLLSARANYYVPNTNLTLFVSGQNLTNEFYVADFNDGAKPGIGRTLWAGFTWKFDHD